jgi:hypothetical protein
MENSNNKIKNNIIEDGIESVKSETKSTLI